MIPLRDDQPTSSFPIVTVLIIALNVVVYLAQQVLPLDASWTMVPYEVTHNIDIAHKVMRDAAGHVVAVYGPSPHPLWLTIYTSMFMHASLLHIGGNMLFLWIFGNNIEDALGKLRYLIFYLVCGTIASLAQILIDPNSLIPNLGASGAIAGVLGAYLILYPNATVLTLVPIFIFFLARIKAYWVLVIWFALQIFQGINGIGTQQGGGVAVFAHIGGFLAGMVIIALLGGKKLAVKQRVRASAPPPPGGY